MATVNRLVTYEGIPIWRHARVIEWALQVVSGVVIVALLIWFFSNIGSAVNDRDIPFGFNFLDREYQTPIGEHFIPYDSSDTFRYAMFVAITNTLLVAVFGVILATALGIVIGVARLSSNWIVSRIALVYIEFFRNVPLLVQLLFWLFIILALPPVREGTVVPGFIYIDNAGISFPGPNSGGSFGATLIWCGIIVLGVVLGVVAYRMLNRRELEMGRAWYPVGAGFAITIGTAAVSWALLAAVGLPPIVIEGSPAFSYIYINNAGISFPGPNSGGDFGATLIWVGIIAVGIVLGVVAYKMLNKRELETGRASYPVIAGVAIAVAVAAVSWALLAAVSSPPMIITAPEPQGRFGRIGGGVTVRAGLLILLIGLVIYTASFIAEIVRAGIQSVGRGQVEAARATGLTPLQALRHVTFPQALRVIIPPMISQYLNLTKNSSLGGAVGYTDLTNVGITMTQTAPAVSIFVLIMIAYLAMSLTWSAIGNAYNRQISFERDEAQSGGVLAMPARALRRLAGRAGTSDKNGERGES